MKKLLKIGVPLVLLLVVAGVVVLYLSLNSIVRDRVEAGAQASLNLPTELDSASVAIFGSDASLGGLSVGNPVGGGFSDRPMLDVGAIDVDASYSALLSDPIRVGKLTVDSPTLLLERGGGNFNFKVAGDGLPPSDAETPDVIVEELTVRDVRVIVDAKLPGVEPLTLTVPQVVLREVGTGEGNQNGAEIGRVVMSTVTAVVREVIQSEDLPAELRPLLAGDFDAVIGQYRSLAQDKATELIDGEVDKLRGRLNEAVGEELGDKLGGEAGDRLKEGLGDLLGGDGE